MIRGKIKEIITSMGFTLTENDSICRASFVDDASGSIIKLLGKMESDGSAVPQIKFYTLDESNNVTGTYTLDQVIMNYETHLLPLPKPSTNKYECVFNLRIQVPVEMWKMSPELYMKYIKEGYTENAKIAQQVASNAIREHFSKISCKILGIEHEYTDRIGGE